MSCLNFELVQFSKVHKAKLLFLPLLWLSVSTQYDSNKLSSRLNNNHVQRVMCSLHEQCVDVF